MIGHPVLKFGIPAGIGDHPAKPVKRAFVSVAVAVAALSVLVVAVASSPQAVKNKVAAAKDTAK